MITKPPNTFQGFFPDPLQLQLLNAILINGAEGKNEFFEWVKQIESIERLDYGSFRLLPLLYRRLQKYEISHPILPDLKDVYIAAWAANQKLFHAVLPVFEALREAEIPAIGFKGYSLSFQYYKDLGVRPMDDVDILVPLDFAHDAIRTLTAMDWAVSGNYPDIFDAYFSKARNSLTLTKRGFAEIDLHWYALHNSLDDEMDALFWENPIEIKTEKRIYLKPTDELFITCIHGIRWNKMPPIRWITDAMAILENSGNLDWDSILAQAINRELSKKLLLCLDFLKTNFNAKIPSDIIRQLRDAPASDEEINDLAAIQKPPDWRADIPYMREKFKKITKKAVLPDGVSGFLKFLQIEWSLKSIFLVPWHVLTLVVKKIFSI